MYRKGVSVIIANNKNDILLVNLRSFNKEYFALPGGGVEPGETLEDAAYREIREELGVTKKSLKYVGWSDSPVFIKFKEITLNREGTRYDGLEKYYFGFNFVGENSDIRLKEDEVHSFRWVPFSKLENYLLFEGQFAQTVEKIKTIFSGAIS